MARTKKAIQRLAKTLIPFQGGMKAKAVFSKTPEKEAEEEKKVPGAPEKNRNPKRRAPKDEECSMKELNGCLQRFNLSLRLENLE